MKKIVKMLFCLILLIVLSACQGAAPGQDKHPPQYTVEPDAVTLTLAGEGIGPVVYNLEDLQKMGTVTLSYSGRNKQVENERQFFTFTGVEVKKLLQKAGYLTEEVNLKLVCSDGYTKECSLEDLYELYTYKDNETDDKEPVVPIIAILEESLEAEYPSRFKMICGQEDWDTKSAQDFNMQNWATYLQYIEVSYDD